MQIDETLISLLVQGNQGAYRYLYDKYYAPLCVYAFKMLHDSNLSEELVQQIIFKMWENRDSLSQVKSLRSYLYSSVHNSVLNYIKHELVKQKYILEQEYLLRNHLAHSQSMEMEMEIRNKLEFLMNDLPEKTQKVIKLKYIEGKKHKEIKDELQMAERTIGVHISSAISFFKEKMKFMLNNQ